MKTAICAINSKYIHSSLAPWYLMAGVNTCAPDVAQVEVLEATINQPKERISSMLLQGGYDVIAFSCYIWNISLVKELVVELKAKQPKVLIVLGGPEVSYNARELLEELPAVNVIIAGEGEKPFTLLLKSIAEKMPFEGIPGLCYRTEEKITMSELYIPSQDPPRPYSPAYFAQLQGRIAYLETSRGCPFSCTFCLSGGCSGIRFFDIARVKEDILLLANGGSKTIKLVDRTFNCNKKRTYELLTFLLAEYGNRIPKNICFHFEIEGDLFDEQTIELLSHAPVGYIQMEIGVQSFYTKTLQAVRRNPKTEYLTTVIEKLLKPRNIHIHIDLIAGLPHETYNEFAVSFNKAYALQADILQLGFLKLLYGSELRGQVQKEQWEFEKEPPYEIVENPWLGKSDLEKLHLVEDALERIYNSGRFKESLQFVLQKSGLNAFQFFYSFGCFLQKNNVMAGISLDEYTKWFYFFCKELSGVYTQELRDVMVCDRLATINTGKLPPVLRIQDKRLKQAAKKLAQMEEHKQPKSIKRGLAFLYASKRVVYVDYCNKNEVTGKYAATYLPASLLEIEL